jgi:hypothetical protein
MITRPVKAIDTVIDDVDMKSNVLKIDLQQMTDVRIILYYQYTFATGFEMRRRLVQLAARLLMLVHGALQVVIQT